MRHFIKDPAGEADRAERFLREEREKQELFLQREEEKAEAARQKREEKLRRRRAARFLFRMRLTALLLGAGAAVCYVFFTTPEEGGFSWVRLALFCGEFLVLTLTLMPVCHPIVHDLMLRRDLRREDEETGRRRRQRRRSALPWRLAGLALTVVLVLGQLQLNRMDWSDLAEGQVILEFEELKALMEQAGEDEGASPGNEGSGIISPETEEEEGTEGSGDPGETGDKPVPGAYPEEQILDRDGNVLYRYTHVNPGICLVKTDYRGTGREPASFTVYTPEDRARGLWKLDAANLVWFGTYPLAALALYVAWRRRLRDKQQYDR